jgi:hypothetical protein
VALRWEQLLPAVRVRSKQCCVDKHFNEHQLNELYGNILPYMVTDVKYVLSRTNDSFAAEIR